MKTGTQAIMQGRGRALFLAAVMGIATACTPIYRNHGWVPTSTELASLQPGVDDRASVIEALGAPSTGGVLDKSNFYYVRSRVKSVGARAPQVETREVVGISFDQRGRVANVARLNLEDGRVVVLETRITDTTVGGNTFVRQLLSGLGNQSPINPAP